MSKKLAEYEPKKCWVGDQQKVCYGSQEDAEGWAKVVEAEHNLPAGSLTTYRCEYGEHWHLANSHAKKKTAHGAV